MHLFSSESKVIIATLHLNWLCFFFRLLSGPFSIEWIVAIFYQINFALFSIEYKLATFSQFHKKVSNSNSPAQNGLRTFGEFELGSFWHIHSFSSSYIAVANMSTFTVDRFSIGFYVVLMSSFPALAVFCLCFFFSKQWLNRRNTIEQVKWCVEPAQFSKAKVKQISLSENDHENSERKTRINIFRLRWNKIVYVWVLSWHIVKFF